MGPPARRVFIVGAGASAAAPAQLPVFGVLREWLLQRLGVPGATAPAARELAPERFMQAVSDGMLPLSDWLSATLSQGSPNAVHHVLRTCLDSGDTVWTLNVDELIEQVSSSPLRTAAYDDSVPDPRAQLLKPHGTVSRGAYIFRTDQVVRPLPDAWSQRLRADGTGSHVVVIGYAGADLDMLAVLDETLNRAASVTWFAITGDRDGLKRRFPGLPPFTTFLGGDRVETLTPAFLDWADRQGLTSRLPADLRKASLSATSLRSPAPLLGDARLAAATIVQRAGRAGEARRLYLALVVRPPWARARCAVAEILRIDLYGETLSLIHI